MPDLTEEVRDLLDRGNGSVEHAVMRLAHEVEEQVGELTRIRRLLSGGVVLLIGTLGSVVASLVG